MEKLFSILKYLHGIAHKGEEALIADAIYSEHGIEIKDDHGLNLESEINRSFYENKAIHDLHEADEEILTSIEHLKKEGVVRGTKSLKGLIRLCLEPFENRKIELERDVIDAEKIKRILTHHKIRSSVVSYKNLFFCPKNKKDWENYSPHSPERIVFYAFPRARGRLALAEIAGILGRAVAEERKGYRTYTSRTYKINDNDGLHARPAANLVTTANRYEGDIWVRTDNMEANAKSIMKVMMLAATHEKRLTILYKPAEQSEKFYKDLELITYYDKKSKEEKLLLTRTK